MLWPRSNIFENWMSTKKRWALVLRIFELTKDFPIEERYTLTDQVRRSSRSVCANLAEAWRRRRYQVAFVSKLNDAETEAGETQVHVRLLSDRGISVKKFSMNWMTLATK
ncbi:MAG: four helix bundle protein, partial [Verrucomicrobia bacterium]|nr:four helix bundle protein [Verrucomicrobiota bacterium]